ncbi:hypothetical protein E2562_038723 [Oryza meyeriana var. granulata]|uniref:Uncharacterized protein n=1 Tax=Oryza meyeriana var. granulata TaxID=110450 RepID=A0A6G1C174_9ORYZ|nr:hypothetical protein E2562_038723 [Oryza meyeriana var. granulata]
MVNDENSNSCRSGNGNRSGGDNANGSASATIATTVVALSKGALNLLQALFLHCVFGGDELFLGTNVYTFATEKQIGAGEVKRWSPCSPVVTGFGETNGDG